jgi:rhodanese-related sulfurtransferase
MVLDVREANELDICKLEGALHIPMAEIPTRVDDLPANQPLVVICHHGARSQMIVDFLRDAGFDNASTAASKPGPARSTNRCDAIDSAHPKKETRDACRQLIR